MKKLVAYADRAPLARLDADAAAQVNQKIQPSGSRDVDWNGFGGRDNAFVSLKEGKDPVAAAKIYCKPEGC